MPPKPTKTPPASLLIDDGAPINLMVGHQPGYPHRFLVPNSFTARFADLCEEYGVRGKFSVVPMPLALGRIDEAVRFVPAAHLAGFLEVVRGRIAPRFDISPELLTHFFAVRLRGLWAEPLFEDRWVAQASLPQITDYLALALTILKRVGLPATGVTSPWMTGEHNEPTYAQAIGQAEWRVHRRRLCWYLLHCSGDAQPARTSVTWQNRRRGQRVVSIPGNTDDVWWNTQYVGSVRAGRAAALQGVERLITADARGGRLIEIARCGAPLTILTHWQSLFSNGRAWGLLGLEEAFRRMRLAWGGTLHWVTCSALARRALRTAAAAASRPPKR